MKLDGDRLTYLIRHYDLVRIQPDSSRLTAMEKRFLDAGLMEVVTQQAVSKNADGSVDIGPYSVLVLSERAKRLVRRRAGLRLVSELLLSCIGPSVSTSDVRKIVHQIPFRALPLLLTCGDGFIQELAARRTRKREFFRRI